jgi:RNA binding exosome subunit
MAGVFHWVRIRLFCYATEDEEKLNEVMRTLSGKDDFNAEMSDGHHGNSMIIYTAELNKDKECGEFFKRLGSDAIGRILSGLEERIDEDCTFHLRLDKQAAVQERYKMAYHGDIISVTCKIASHPARKEIAERNMRAFLESLF